MHDDPIFFNKNITFVGLFRDKFIIERHIYNFPKRFTIPTKAMLDICRCALKLKGFEMIRQFDLSTALLLIDVQKGVNDTAYYGGPTGRRNNLGAEDNMCSILIEWRKAGRQVAFTKHDSREENSPLKLGLESGQQLEGLETTDDDIVIEKDVNSGFIGTSLELDLRRAGIQRLVAVGFFTNVCVETTVRMAGNMGFDTYLVHDACATMNSVGHDGTDYDPDLVHNMAIASLHGEFCTAITTKDALGLCASDAHDLDRVQGNE